MRYDFKNKGSVLHNLIVDLGIQVVVLVLIFILYIISGCSIIHTVRRYSRRKRQPTENAHPSFRRKCQRKKLQRILLLQAICLTLPVMISLTAYQLVMNVNLSHTSLSVATKVCEIMSRLSYFVNPFVYLALNHRLRKVVKKLFCKYVIHRQSKSFTLLLT